MDVDAGGSVVEVESTVSRAPSFPPEAFCALKRAGYASVINLRAAEEPGAVIEAQATAAHAAGLQFVHLPFSVQSPDAAAVDAFLTAVTVSANVPALIHCRTGNRAAALWSIARVRVQGWAIERAMDEAVRLGLRDPMLRQFAVDYLTLTAR